MTVLAKVDGTTAIRLVTSSLPAAFRHCYPTRFPRSARWRVLVRSCQWRSYTFTARAYLLKGIFAVHRKESASAPAEAFIGRYEKQFVHYGRRLRRMSQGGWVLENGLANALTFLSFYIRRDPVAGLCRGRLKNNRRIFLPTKRNRERAGIIGTMLMPRTISTTLAAVAVLVAGCSNATGGSAAVPTLASPTPVVTASATPAVSPYNFDATRSYADLKTQVAFGPRYSGSEGYPKMVDWLRKTLSEASGLTAKKQDFTAKPGTKTLPMSNVYVQFNPEAKTQVLLCAHYDTRPTADQEIDPAKKKQPIPGANDGASGVAVLLELARVLKAKAPTCGVQIVFFDGEDYGPGEEDMYLGAKVWAKTPPLPKPTYAILIDMIGDKSLQIYREQASEDLAPEINDKVWNAAAALKMPGFENSVKYAISDDHIPLQKAGIKAIDLIDFDYGPWHTLDDTPEQCSPDSLRAVGDVLAKVVYDEK